MQAELKSVSGLKGFLQIFETQFPMSKQGKEKQRAQSQVMSCCSSKCTAFPSSGESPNVSLSEVFTCGFTSTMKFSGIEFLGMSSVRLSFALQQSCGRSWIRPRTIAFQMKKLWSSRLDEPWIQALLKKGKVDGNSI